MESKILVVDDEKPIVDILKYNLEKDGYKVLIAYDGEEAIRIATSEEPDLILLDIMLPKIDGFSVCKTLRQKLNTPILMVTAKEEEVDKVLGLELGADDYIVKPFSMRELAARIKANLRRVQMSEDADGKSITYGDLVIDLDKYVVRKKASRLISPPESLSYLNFWLLTRVRSFQEIRF